MARDVTDSESDGIRQFFRNRVRVRVMCLMQNVREDGCTSLLYGWLHLSTKLITNNNQSSPSQTLFTLLPLREIKDSSRSFAVT